MQQDSPIISQEDINVIQKAIAETAKAQAKEQANSAAQSVMLVISEIVGNCSNVDVHDSEKMDDVVNCIVIPAIKGTEVGVPKWMEQSAINNILEATRDFSVRTGKRFTPLPVGTAKISPYQIEETLVEGRISITIDDKGIWLASDGTNESSGDTPSSALNNFLKMTSEPHE